MTEQEIIKGLQCCSGILRCVDCPYTDIENCATANTIDAISLINSLKAENERLKELLKYEKTRKRLVIYPKKGWNNAKI